MYVLGRRRVTARNLTPPDEGIALREEARREGLNELARDMRDFNWEDEDAARDRYATLVNVTLRRTRCGAYCLRQGKCRFGYPHPRQETIQITAHPLVHPPTDRIEDWQVVVLPPRSSPPAEGEDGEGEHDGYVNRHVIVQILGWGGNVDAFVHRRPWNGLSLHGQIRKQASRAEETHKNC